MKAFVKTKYGGPEVLQLQEVDKPTLQDDQLLVKVRANSANPADWHIIRGKPYFARLSFGLFKPKYPIAGADFAGTIEAVGKNVSGYQVGDRVFGQSLAGGAFAEYTCITPNACAHMPANAGFAEMAAVPIAGLTALQALVTHGKLQPGESVLINGSSGGVGHFAVQIAKAYGARVTAVCSERNRDFVLSIGADEVIAYDKVDIHQHPGKYDLVLDTHGNLYFGDFKRMGKRGVITGFTTMGHMIAQSLKKLFNRFPLAQFTAAVNTTDLETLAGLIGEGKVKPQIDKTYSYRDIPEAIGYIEAMHTRGKVVMVWEDGVV